MPASDKNSELAKQLAAASGPVVLGLMKKAATSKVATKLRDQAVATTATGALKGGTDLVTRRRAESKYRKLAIDLAKQKGGSYSEAVVIDNERYFVVWDGRGAPYRTYPELPAKLGPVASHPDLEGFSGDRIPPDARKNRQRRSRVSLKRSAAASNARSNPPTP